MLGHKETNVAGNVHHVFLHLDARVAGSLEINTQTVIFAVGHGWSSISVRTVGRHVRQTRNHIRSHNQRSRTGLRGSYFHGVHDNLTLPVAADQMAARTPGKRRGP